MRKAWMVFAGVAIIAAGAAVWRLKEQRPPGASGRSDEVSQPPSRSWWLWSDSSTSTSARRTIRGTVVGANGPIPGAVVAAYAAMDDGADGCPKAERCELDAAPCDTGDEATRWVQRVLNRDEALQPIATTTSGTDGRFELGLGGAGARVVTARSGTDAAFMSEFDPNDDVVLRVWPARLLRGKVLDERGQPLSGALVFAFSEEGGPVVEGYSAADGSFAIGPLLRSGWTRLMASHADLAPANHRFRETDVVRSIELVLRPLRKLRGRVIRSGVAVDDAVVCARIGERSAIVRSDSEGTFSFEATGAPRSDGSDIASASFIELAARSGGDQARRRAALTANAEVILELAAAVSIRGTVRSSDGTAVERVQVELLVDGERMREVKLGPDGHFSEEGLPAGLVRIEAAAAACESSTHERLLAPGEAAVLDLMLSRQVPLRGIVVDELGRPAIGASLMATSSEWAVFFRPSYESTSDGDGAFELLVPRTGDYRVVASRHGLTSTSVAATAPNDSLRIVLPTGERVIGEVVDDAGKPQRLAVAIGRAGESSPYFVVESDAAGRFELHGIQAGRHVAVAPPLNVFGESSVGKAAFDVPSRTPVRLVVAAAHTISGRVVDADTSKPHGDVRVRASSTDNDQVTFADDGVAGFGSSHASTGVDGRFVVGGLRSGSYRLTIDSDDLVADPPQITGRTGTEVLLRARHRGWIRGRVLTAAGTPSHAFRVNGEQRTSEEGTFAVRATQPGQQTLRFDSGPGTPSAARTVSVVFGRDTVIGDVSLPEGREVRGRVVDAKTGEPVPVALVAMDDDGLPRRLTSRDAAWMPTTRTGYDGSFVFRNVDADGRFVVVDHPDYLVWAGQLQRGVLTVELLRGGAIRGRVLDGRGVGMGISVMLGDLRTAGETATTEADRHGGFRFSGLPPGRYGLWAEGGGLRPSRFHSAVVTIVGDEEVVAEVRERVEGTDLTVDLQLPPEADQPFVFLVPGEPTPPSSFEDAEVRLSPFWVLPEFGEGRGPFTFKVIPAGRHSLFVIAHASGSSEEERVLLHRQLLLMPSPAPTVQIVVPPTTTRIPRHAVEAIASEDAP